MYRNVSKCIEMYRNVSKCIEMYRNVSGKNGFEIDFYFSRKSIGTLVTSGTKSK